MKCPNCGGELDARPIFCIRCGKKIDYDIVDMQEADAKKTRREHYEDALEDSPFAGIYAKNARRWSIVIAILDIITWGMFFGDWYKSDFGSLFGMGDYGLFDIYKYLVLLNKYDGSEDLGIPSYLGILLFAIIVLYLISSAYFFRSIYRNFANKVHVKTQIKASVFALITALISYITVVIFQNGLDNEIGAKISSYLIAPAAFLYVFAGLNVLLIIFSCSYLKNSKIAFSDKAYNVFSIITVIYMIGLIIGLLISSGVISLPFPSLHDETEEYEYDYRWGSSNSYVHYDYDDYDYSDYDYDYSDYDYSDYDYDDYYYSNYGYDYGDYSYDYNYGNNYSSGLYHNTEDDYSSYKKEESVYSWGDTSENDAYSDNTDEASDNSIQYAELINFVPSGITADSELAPIGSNTYSPTNMIDDDDTTAYCEGSAGLGIGETVTFNFDEAFYLRSMSMENGYWKNEEIYDKNGKLKTIHITCYLDGAAVYENDVENLEYNEMKINTMDFDYILADCVEITITDAVAGSKYEDVCISEVTFSGCKSN